MEKQCFDMKVSCMRFYTEVTPASFFYIEMRNETLGSVHSGHSPYFMIDENILPTGVAYDVGKKFQKWDGKKRSSQTIEIFKGDTLWKLSREYGVSVEEIKATNGFSDDTIYAGEKITLP